MIKIVIAICWFFVSTKLLFFWLWLWQLKEYHLGRFKAHFETQKSKKLFFSLHSIRYPKITGKTILILFSGILLEFFILSYLFSFQGYLFYLLLLISIILMPIIFSFLILFFQIPTVIFKKWVLEKARKKAEKFSAQGGLIIGIAGSYGKSSTKEFLATILSVRFKVLKTRKNINSEIGIAKTILEELRPEHQVFIAEIGAYERGKIKEDCKMVQPKIGILTGINEQHLSIFGSQENIIKAKFELIENLTKDGIAILNGKNKYIKKRFKGQESKVKSIETEKDIWAEDIRVEKEFVYFKVKTKDNHSADFKVNLLGRQNVENLLLAISCARELGMSLKEISDAALKIKPEQGGMKFLKKLVCWPAGERPVVIDSSYSANPTGVMADLDYLQIYKEKKTIIMPCLIELGKSSGKIHKEIGKKIGEICYSAIITTKDKFKEIKEGALESGMKEENIILEENPEKIVKIIKSFNQKNILLLESRLPKRVSELCF